MNIKASIIPLCYILLYSYILCCIFKCRGFFCIMNPQVVRTYAVQRQALPDFHSMQEKVTWFGYCLSSLTLELDITGFCPSTICPTLLLTAKIWFLLSRSLSTLKRLLPGLGLSLSFSQFLHLVCLLLSVSTQLPDHPLQLLYRWREAIRNRRLFPSGHCTNPHFLCTSSPLGMFWKDKKKIVIKTWNLSSKYFHLILIQSLTKTTQRKEKATPLS